MRKRLILLSILLIITIPFFIPVTIEKTVTIKAPFLNVFSLLLSPDKWEKWRTDLRKIAREDSSQLTFQKDSGSFVIAYGNDELHAVFSGGSFEVKDGLGNGTARYKYSLAPDKTLRTTFVTVDKKINAVSYAIGKMSGFSFADTHVDDLKHFLETDSLRYGCNIFKTRVPESNMIEIKKEVLNKDKFSEAAKMLTEMQRYVKTHGVKQIQPLIAQFLPKGKDSTQVNVGFYIDKEVKSDNDVTFTRMPKGGPLYAAKFYGRFNRRQLVYLGIHQYFIDHLYQQAILPFESYLDNKLPTSDTSKVNIQVNFSTYF